MKKEICLLLSLLFIFIMAGCGNQKADNRTENAPSQTDEQIGQSTDYEQEGSKTENQESEEIVLEPEQESDMETKILVVYFSATGTTKPLAEYAAEILNADLYEIVPEDPYTEADLAYYTNGRADREQNDSSARPAISGGVENIEEYDTIILGYPIWHGQAPRIISTFLESYDFTGKRLVPFCTSHSSGLGSSAEELHDLVPEADWSDGARFAASATAEEVLSWLESVELADENAGDVGVFDFDTRTVLLNSGYEMPINGLGTYSLHGEECINSVTAALNSGVRLIDTAHAYGNEVEIGEAIRDSGIPREEIFVITKLYPDQFAEPEAAIEEALENLDLGYIDMMLLHHPGSNDVEAYHAMEKAVEEGKIRSIGLSNWYVEELEEFLPQVTIMPALVQNEIHPYYQENDVIPYIQDLGIVVQGWYPLGGRGHTAELLGDPVISEIAEAHGKSSAQVILRWNLQKGVVVIPGSSNPDHIQENTELYDFTLTEEEMSRINALDRNEKHDWY
ncbi:MAG: aldo/keto reductase [Enterocloster citroniae]|nr:aldo/keto reductase [Enterocloster citroniae]